MTTALPSPDQLPGHIVKEGFYYTDSQKEQFVLDYFETGNLKLSAEKLGVPYDSAKLWKRSEWFGELIGRLETEHNKSLKKRLDKIADQALSAMEDRIQNGEERITKSGKKVNMKANLSSLTMAAGVLLDKAQVLKKVPVQEASAEETLSRLADMIRNAVKPKMVPYEEATIVETGRAVSGGISDTISP
jgi:hypothetical protein